MSAEETLKEFLGARAAIFAEYIETDSIRLKKRMEVVYNTLHEITPRLEKALKLLEMKELQDAMDDGSK